MTMQQGFPYWNYDLGTLTELVRQNPGMATHLPRDVWDQFPNEVFVQNPAFAQYASPQRMDIVYRDRPEIAAGLGVNPGMTYGALTKGGWTTDPSTGALMTPTETATPRTPRMTTPKGVETSTPAAGTFNPEPELNPPGSIGAGGLTGMQLTQGGVNMPLPGDVSAAIQGRQMPTQQTFGNLPRFSAQSYARLLPSSRVNLGVLANRTGNRAEDFLNMGQQLSQQPQGALPSYRRGIPGPTGGY